MNAQPGWLRFLIISLVLVVCGATPAGASVEVEPNDGPDDTAHQVALVDGTKIAGALLATDDLDSFRIMVGAGRPGRVEFTLTNTSPASTGAMIAGAVTDRTGDEDLATTADPGLAPGQSAVVSATLLAGGAYRFAIGFACDGETLEECPGTVAGATWALSVKVRTGTLLLDATGVLGAAADAASERALDALMSSVDDEEGTSATTASVGGVAVACATQSRALQAALRRVDRARRANLKRHSKASRRKLRVAKTARTLATVDLANCKAIAESAAKAAEAALATEPTE